MKYLKKGLLSHLLLFMITGNLISFWQAINDTLWHADKVEIQGYLGEKLNASCQNRILAQNAPAGNTIDERSRFRVWLPQFSARWNNKGC